MKKVLKKLIAFVFLLSMLYSFSACGFGVAWVWGGIRFTPDDAIEAVSLNKSKNEKIQTDDYTFYIETFLDKDDWIENVYPVAKTDLGMYHAITRLGQYTQGVYIGADLKQVGRLITLEGENAFYHFFIPEIEDYDPLVLPLEVPTDYNSVVIDGETIEIYKHSYFITKNLFKNFSINCIAFQVGY